jgi:processive 1,2-diacylglycerol beta-glucosyltransferase
MLLHPIFIGGDMMRESKLLILYGLYGEGHKQAAKALQDMDPSSKIVDIMDVINVGLNKVSRRLYIQLVKSFPKIYGHFYDLTKREYEKFAPMEQFLKLAKKKIHEFIKIEQPSTIISTFPLASAILSTLNIPFKTVITDHTAHPSWVHQMTEKYFVGSSYVKEELLSMGVDENKIFITGIPIRSTFLHPHTAMVEKGDLPTMLIMGGGFGLIDRTLVQYLEGIPERFLIYYVCGRNKRLRRDLRKNLNYSHHDIHILGFIDYVQDLMRITDIMISKPGGLTISEAIALQAPLLVYHPLPGQEEENANYIIETGMGSWARNQIELAYYISKMLYQPCFTDEMKKRMKQLHYPEAAADIVKLAKSDGT